MLEWDGWKKNNVGHYTLDADGFIRGNNFLVCVGIAGGLKDGYHPQRPGETTEYIGPSGKPLFSLEMLSGGKGLVMRRPGSSIEWRVRSETPADAVAIAYRQNPAAEWQELGTVSVTDDTEAGELVYVFRRTTGESLDREHVHYCRDTGRILRCSGFNFAKVAPFDHVGGGKVK